MSAYLPLKGFNKNYQIYLTALVMLTVSHQTSYCISSVVTNQLNKSLAQWTMTV